MKKRFRLPLAVNGFEEIMSYTVILKKNEEKRILWGESWVYANEVAEIQGKGKNGDLATVRAADGRYLGKGYINHLSKILVRIFIRDDSVDDKALFLERIKYADTMRKNYCSDNCYRAIFAESDYLPGLIVDRYDDVLSVQILTLGMELKKDLIVECLVEHFSPRSIIERSDVAVREKEGLPLKKGVLWGEDVSETLISENGLKIKVDLLDGQKTGYFLDQKYNRLALRNYSKDKTVLDCFCNAGGFSLNASFAGAKKVYALDISKTALSEVETNAKLNDITNVETVLGDVFEKLREYKKQDISFDLIILDPPAFCKNANELKRAYQGYKDINILAMKILKKGGILVSSSCTHFMTQTLFKKMLAESAANCNKQVKLLEERMQSLDHPSLLSAQETAYLKFCILQID